MDDREFGCRVQREFPSVVADLIDLAVAEGIVGKAGAWYSFENEKIGQGRENSKKFIAENKEVYEKIKRLVLEKHGLSSDSSKDKIEASSKEAVAEAKKTTKKSSKKIQ